MKLYHYTSIDTLFAMLEKSIIEDDYTNVKYIEFWARHTSCLKDKSEYKFFIDKLIEKVKEHAQSLNHNFSDDELTILDRINRSHLYTISLTNNGDSHYMWKEYGGNHTGVCFEIDFDAVPPFYRCKDGRFVMENAYNSMLTKCEYVQAKDLEVEEHLVANVYQCVINKGNNDVVKDAAVLAGLENTAITYKMINFAQESEYRFVLGSIYNQEHLRFPIPISAITSIILGSSIVDDRIIDNITQQIIENLGHSVYIRKSNCL